MQQEKRDTENWETWLSYLSMDHFVQWIILYCVHLSLYTVPTLELNMPKFTAGSQSSPFPYTSLMWRTSSSGLYCIIMAVTLRYFTEFGKPALQKTMCGGIYATVYCIFSAVQCRRKESSRSLSHLLMSFLLAQVTRAHPLNIQVTFVYQAHRIKVTEANKRVCSRVICLQSRDNLVCSLFFVLLCIMFGKKE